MQTPEEIIRSAVRAERWARIRRVLEQRLGSVRVVLDSVHHPHNLSAVLRTCEALGIQHIHVVEASASYTWSRRITMGAHKWLTVHRHREFSECAEELHSLGFKLYAALLDPSAVPLDEVPARELVALVLGNEKQGVSPGARSLCDGAYTIPMFGFAQSLNISVAAALSLYEVTKRARTLRPDGGLLSAADREDLLASWLPKSVRCGRRIMSAAGQTPSPLPEV